MDRGAWPATVHGVAESNMTQWLTFSLSLFPRVNNINSTAIFFWFAAKFRSECLSRELQAPNFFLISQVPFSINAKIKKYVKVHQPKGNNKQ